MNFNNCRSELTLAALIFLSPGLLKAQSSAVQKPSSISLSPSVVMLRGTTGASHRQSLRITNFTPVTMLFEMEARDVVIENGKRKYIPAGDLDAGIAATAVFSRREIEVPPAGTESVDVTLTFPHATQVRAVVVYFRGKTRVQTSSSLNLTGSLGSLITFTFSDSFDLVPRAARIQPQTATSSFAVVQNLFNQGKEPVLAGGVVALLNDKGSLVGKVKVEPKRLLPGEEIEFKTEYPGELAPGQYRALLTYEYENKVATSTQEFAIRRNDADIQLAGNPDSGPLVAPR